MYVSFALNRLTIRNQKNCCLLCSRTKQLRLLEFNPDGTYKDVLAMMKSLGYVVGDSVMHKSDKVKASVESITDDKVKLALTDVPGGSKFVSVNSFVNGEWKHFNSKPDPTCLDVLPLPSASNLFKNMKTATNICQEVFELALVHENVLSGLKVTFKPSKAVTATRNFEKHKLVLVPLCSKVEVVDKESKNGVIIHHDGVKFSLIPWKDNFKESSEIVVPYWNIPQREEYNMEITHVKGKAYKMVIARNVRPIKQGEDIFFEKPKQAGGSTSSLAADASAKKRKTSP